MKRKRFSRGFRPMVWVVLCLLSGCTLKPTPPPGTALIRVPGSGYPDFSDDMNYEGLSFAVPQSISYLEKIPSDRRFAFGNDSYTAAHILRSLKVFLDFIRKKPTRHQLSRFIAENYRVYSSIGKKKGNGEKEVLFTGYYEPFLSGSLKRRDGYQYPIYSLPDDLVTIDLSLFSQEYGHKRLVGRYTDRTVVPYFDRRQIEEQHAIQGKALPLAWVNDPVDLFFLHIQGSGKVYLDNGRVLNVHYHRANGRPYRSIGKLLIEENKIKKINMSMQAIKAYLRDHPDEIRKIFNHNASYVFFKVEKDGPMGSLNVPLTPGRSVATDHRLFPKASLAFIQTKKPLINSDGGIQRWVNCDRFVLNQDTGGAIQGPGRADLFWGNGSYAEMAAGYLQHTGRLYFLVLNPADH